MSAAPDTLPTAPSTRPWAGVAGRTAARLRLAVYAACALIALIINCFLGQDVGWDTIDYHLYAGFSALHDRFGQDYFAAGPQSYFNPYVYAPFYAMVRAGLSPLVVSTVLALAQSTLLWLTFELGVCAGPSSQGRMRLACGAGAVAFAFLNPVLLYQLGSSSADIATAIPVLGGWLCLAYAVRTPRHALVVAAGLLLGAAAGLKLTNAVHAVSAAAMLITLPRSLGSRLRYAVAYGASLALGLALVMAPWSYRLAQHFGNPLFPMFNGGFHAAQRTGGSLRHFRFIPDSFADALWRPFAIAQPDSMVQVEQMAPDVRYAALLLLCAAVVARWLWQRRRGAPPVPAHNPGDLRVLVALGCGLATDWILWLHASGNGRYFLPMASVAGVLVVALLLRAFSLRAAAAIIALIFIVQGVQLYLGTDRRDGALAWDHPWLEVTLPRTIATEANLYLTMGVQANAFIAPYLPPGSGLINFDGGYAMSQRGVNGERIAALLHRYGPRHVRVLVTGSSLHDGGKEGPQRSNIDDALARLGLRTDARDCETITARGVPAPLEPVVAGKTHETRSPHLQLLTCATQTADPADLARRAERQRQVDLVLDRLEDTCPQLFGPHGYETQQIGEVWLRYYGGTDLVAFVNRGQVKFLGTIHGPDAQYLGKESEWAVAPVPLVCGRHNGVYSARPAGAPVRAMAPKAG
jgi:hypothetical protein